MKQSHVDIDRLSRRRLLALAGGATAAMASSSRVAARQDATDAPPTGEFPMPSTLAADASREFQVVAHWLIEEMRRLRVPGAAIGILHGDREEHATFGVASISSLAPVTADTLFQIGSLSKTHTATAIWRLIDEGALALNAPVRTYIPELQLADESVAADVTVGNLLDHSAGWFGDDVFDTGDGDDAIARYVADRLPTTPQLFPLGEYFSYSNTAFILQGRLIEVATGAPYHVAMENLLFGPLGLADSLLDRSAVRRRHYTDAHVALPINGRDVVTIQTPLWTPRSLVPAGGIWSTTRDVLRYARFHLAASTTASSSANVVSPESLLSMREPVLKIPGLPLSIGRSWFLQEVDGVSLFTHNGATLGQGSELVVIPEYDFALAIMANSSAAGLIAMRVIDAALANYPGLEALSGKAGILHAFLAPADAELVPQSPEKLAEYVGHYAVPGIGYNVTLKNGALEIVEEIVEATDTVQAAIQPIQVPPPPTPIDFLANGDTISGGIRLPFVRDAAGQVGWLTQGARLIPRVEGD